MSSRQIVYADVSTPERREDYLQNCACIPNDPRRKRRVEQLMSSVPTDSPPIPLYQVPQRAPPAKEARVSEEPKHQYTFGLKDNEKNSRNFLNSMEQIILLLGTKEQQESSLVHAKTLSQNSEKGRT